MSFIIAGCVLLLALIVSMALDDIGVRRRHEARRDVPFPDAW